MSGMSEKRITVGMLLLLVAIAVVALVYNAHNGGGKRLHQLVNGAGTPGPAAALLPASVYTTRNLTSSGAVNACINRSVQCAVAFVQAVNVDRSTHGAPPLTLSWEMTNGQPPGCVGGRGHAQHLASVGFSATTAHDQFPADVCGSYSAAGENVGAYPGTKYNAMLGVLQLELSEPWQPGCTFNHACNVRSATFTQMSVGFARDAAGSWIVVNTFKR